MPHASPDAPDPHASAALPETMTAIEITAPGGPEVLRPVRRPLPKAGAGDVLIRVMAAGVNRPDVFQRQGHYPPPPGASDIPGLEIAGEVVAVADGVDAPSVGDRVMALVAGGGYAEFCVAPAGSCLPWPAGYNALNAAALPETLFTVWSNVFDRGGLQAGQSLLVHGGTSGIGTLAIQLGRVFGATVFATAGSREKCAVCERLGARRAIDYRAEDFVAVVKAETAGRGVNVILDMVGGAYVDRNYQAAAEDGRIVQIALLAGATAEANFARLMAKRLVHTGSTLRGRDAAFKAGIARALKARVWPYLESGEVAPLIDTVVPFPDAAAAHRLIETDHVGKIVLALS